MTTIIDALFTWPLGDGAVLIPRTPDLADAHYALVQANYKRLSNWFPDAYQEAPTMDGVRAALARAGQVWLDGSALPLSLAMACEDGFRLIGWINLEIDRMARSAEVGYWLDADFVGRGLVSRAVTAVLDHAFGPMGLDRVGIQAVTDNARSRAVAERLGFTLEGVIREHAAFPTGRRDLAIYGILAREWRERCAALPA